MYYCHALSENWQEMEYLDFILERRKMIDKVIRDAYFVVRD